MVKAIEFHRIVCNFQLKIGRSSQTNPLSNYYYNSATKKMDLTQQVCEPTHVSGSTLDYVISRNDEKTVIASSVVTGEYVSDHCAVLCKLQIEKPKEHWSEVKYRKIKKIKNDVFAKDLTSIVNNLSIAGHEDRVKLYFSSLRSILDQHAPSQKRLLPIRPHSPWYTDEITQAKKERRRREKRWRHTGLTVHYQIYIKQRNLVKWMITDSKRSYFKDKIEENSTNPRALFTIIEKVLHRKTESALSEHTSEKELAENFSTYFQSKISKIRASLDSQKQSSNPLTFDAFKTNCSFDSFSSLSEVKIDKIIKQSPSKSCDLDPLPTSLMKENMSSILPLITEIVNDSLSSGHVPEEFKVAHVTPLLKNTSLDKNVLKNYRPVSNLPFV